MSAKDDIITTLKATRKGKTLLRLKEILGRDPAAHEILNSTNDPGVLLPIIVDYLEDALADIELIKQAIKFKNQ